jgi:hypothetical protein
VLCITFGCLRTPVRGLITPRVVFSIIVLCTFVFTCFTFHISLVRIAFSVAFTRRQCYLSEGLLAILSECPSGFQDYEVQLCD